MNKETDKKKLIIIFFAVAVFIVILSIMAISVKKNKSTSKISKSVEPETTTITAKTSEANSENITSIQTSAAETETKEPQSAETETKEPQPADMGTNENTKGGALSVSGSQLTDASGNIVQLKGLSTHGLSWYPDYVNGEFFGELKQEFGINVVRLAMYTDDYNGYCAGGDKEYLKNLIDKGVSYASENEMYAIIDWHILSDGNPNKYVEEAKAFFDEMSKKYAGNNNVLYEICNEPNGNTTWEDVKSYAVQIIDVIRKNDEDSVIIVGTPEWCQRIDLAADNPITGYQNIMYSLHFYAATHTDELRKRMSDSINKGLPVFVSEFGICDASGNGLINEAQADEWVNLMNKYNVSYVMWNISNKNESSAIFNPSCSKKSGFKMEDLSQAGQWFLKLMAGGLNPAVNETQQSDLTADTKSSEITTQEDTVNMGGSTNVQAQVQIENSWEADGKTFYKYKVSVTNNSGSNCTSWHADINFNEEVSLSDGWNAEFEVSGNRIRLTSKDYNGTIKNGESMENIGFIISGSDSIKVN